MEPVMESVHEIDFFGVDDVVRMTGLKFYDASYVWLARSRACRLFTRDRQILRCCPDVALDWYSQ